MGKTGFQVLRGAILAASIAILWVAANQVQVLFQNAFPEFSWNLIWHLVFWVGLALLYSKSRVEIQNEPFHVGVPTIFGRRMNKVALSGTVFLPLYPAIFNVIAVDMERHNEIVKPTDVVTDQDMQEITTELSFAYTADADNLVTFLNQEGHEGVCRDVSATVANAVRELAINPDPTAEPHTWEQALKAHSKIVAAVAAKAFGNGHIDLVSLMQGSAKLKIEQLGIVINRLSVEKIEAPKELVEAKRKAKEEEITEARQKKEIAHESDLIKTLKEQNPGLSESEILRHVQAKRGLVKIEAQESKFDFGDKTLKGLEKINNLTLVVGGMPMAQSVGKAEKGDRK